MKDAKKNESGLRSRIRVRFEIIEKHLTKFETLLRKLSSNQSSKLAELTDKAQSVIEITKKRLKIKYSGRRLGVDPDNAKLSLEEQLQRESVTLLFFSKIILPKDKPDNKNIAEEIWVAGMEASEELQKIFTEIKTILKI